MKLGNLALLLLLPVAIFAATPEPSYPAPVQAFNKLSFKHVLQKELPDGVHFWASGGLESNEDPNFGGNICYLDFNGDGAKEIVVESSEKHHNQYEFWQKCDGRWVAILTVGGPFDLLRKRNGYYQISVWREDRFGVGTRELYAFAGARYHAKRIDRYQDKVFTRTLDTREREEVLEINFKVQFLK